MNNNKCQDEDKTMSAVEFDDAIMSNEWRDKRDAEIAAHISTSKSEQPFGVVPA